MDVQEEFIEPIQINNELLLRDLKKLIQDLEHDKRKVNKLAEDIGIRQLSNVYSNMINQSKTKARNLSFSKTLGTETSINDNKNHLLAKAHTLIHLKSNSVCSWIPKVGCSNIRFSIALANGAISSSEDIGWIHGNNASFCADNKELLNADYAFTFLRNPFKRLVSFFLDKLCHDDPNRIDLSYSHAQKIFGTSESTSFKDFVKILEEKPSLIDKDTHTRRQSDFLIYNQYDDYFSLENYSHATQTILSKTGLEIIDTRNINSVKTTYKLEESTEINYNTKASEIKRIMLSGKKPSIKNMYTNEMCKTVGILYLPDILIYIDKVKDPENEMNYWINRAIHEQINSSP